MGSFTFFSSPTMTRLFYVFCLLSPVSVYAQTADQQVLNRAVFWTEVNLVFKTAGRWSFQFDHQYRRQADDNNGRDLNPFRHPLLQVFRPWINYQLSDPVRLSLSPVGLWWNWGRVSDHEPTTFFQEIRVIPQVQIARPAGDGEFIQRYRTELRWASRTDTLANTYAFLSDGESRPFLADRFSTRLRAMARWINPIFRRGGKDSRWYSHLSTEPMLVLSASGMRFDQNRLYVALGRKIRKNLRLELGYLNQFALQRTVPDRLRLYRFNHALHFYVYLENNRPSRAKSDSGPTE